MTNPVELLLCDENSLTLFSFFEEEANNDNINSLVMLSYHEAPQDQDSIFTLSAGSQGVFPLPPMLTDDCFQEMLLRENHHLPKDDYLQRLRNGILPISARTEAIDWISMAASHFSFGTLCICLSVNFLDRFLSVYDLPSGREWTVQLLAVACLSLAAKVAETNVPQSIDLQVGEPKFAFEAKTIQRMELLVLSTLRWRISALTPCSFIDYFLNKISKDQPPSRQCISRSLKLIVSTIKGINFLSYKPSEIAAAIAICASGDAQVVNPDEPMSCFNHIGKERVLKCQNLIKDLSFVGGPVVGQANAAQNWNERDYSVVNVRCKDRSKLLFDIVCTLTDMEYVVYHATINTSSDGLLGLQEFYIRHIDGTPISSEAEKQRVILCIQAAIQRRASEGVRLELCTDDRQGLLADVTRTFRENGLNVTRAEVSTKVDTARNEFYVTDAVGNPADPKIIESVRERIGLSNLKVKELPVIYPQKSEREDQANGAILFSLGSLVRRNLYNLGLMRSYS